MWPDGLGVATDVVGSSSGVICSLTGKLLCSLHLVG